MSTPATQVFVSSNPINVVQVATPGPQGIQGPQGNAGPQGSIFFGNRISAMVPSGVTDNFSPGAYIPGTTNCLILTPTDSTSALSGLVATGLISGFTLIIWNASPTVSMSFLNQASSVPANQFACPGAGTVSLAPFSKTILVYLVNQWTL